MNRPGLEIPVEIPKNHFTAAQVQQITGISRGGIVHQANNKWRDGVKYIYLSEKRKLMLIDAAIVYQLKPKKEIDVKPFKTKGEMLTASQAAQALGYTRQHLNALAERIFNKADIARLNGRGQGSILLVSKKAVELRAQS